MKEPTPADAARCLRLRKRSKLGHDNSADDQRFCRKMFREFPDWYSATQHEVFNDTVPFGSQARMEPKR